ncbi:hypothetical protein ACO2RV_25075, partial [Ancylobacter sp. VNQ12]
MQTKDDGKHAILPAAAPIGRRPDRARMPVMQPRGSDGKMRRDGSSAADEQPNQAVDERGGLHGAPGLSPQEPSCGAAPLSVLLNAMEKRRRCRTDLTKHNRLGRQDK